MEIERLGKVNQPGFTVPLIVSEKEFMKERSAIEKGVFRQCHLNNLVTAARLLSKLSLIVVPELERSINVAVGVAVFVQVDTKGTESLDFRNGADDFDRSKQAIHGFVANDIVDIDIGIHH